MKNKNRKNIIITVMFLTAIISVGIITLLSQYNFFLNTDEEKQNISSYDKKKTEVIKKEKSQDEIIDEKAEKLLSEMTLEEKVGQLFIVNLEELNNGEDCTQFTDNMSNAIDKYHVGGVIYFANNIVNRNQTLEMNKSLQKYSKIPMFISVDEEGGLVSRIADNPNMGTTKISSMRKIGDSGDVSKAYEAGLTIGKDISELGFNLDFAPDADVITNPNNTEIGNRSFGTDKEIVAEMVPQIIKGLHENNVCSTLKHFPGHGGSQANSHNEFSYTEQNLEGMRSVEFLPFIAGIKEDTDFILVSHIAAPNVTKNNIPCSLNNIIVTNILRHELNYENIIITDALNMKAVSNYYSSTQAVVEAIKAGNDMVLMPENIDSAYNALIGACNHGDISEERLNESVKRILKIKLKRNIINC